MPARNFLQKEGLEGRPKRKNVPLWFGKKLNSTQQGTMVIQPDATGQLSTKGLLLFHIQPKPVNH